MRIRWYSSAAGQTFASYALTAVDNLPKEPLPDALVDSLKPYPAQAPPVFFGHYWLRAERPERMAPNVACLDYSVAKRGMLCGYRWDGESELANDKFVSVASKARGSQ